MNFFQAQNKARHNTRLLTLLFVGAVVSLVVLTNLLVLLFFTDSRPGMSFTEQITNAPDELWLYTSLGVVGLIAVASGFKFLALQGGGKAVATGARRTAQRHALPRLLQRAQSGRGRADVRGS